MAMVEVKCPICGSENVIEYGKSRSGKQRYCCKNNECPRKIFQLEYRYNGCKPGIDGQIVDMTAFQKILCKSSFPMDRKTV